MLCSILAQEGSTFAAEKMKTIADITYLRQSGQLDEALAEVEILREANPRDYSVACCAAWVYISLMKQHAHYSRCHLFYTYLRKMKALNLPIDRETILYENVLWAIRQLLADCVQNANSEKDDLADLIAILQDFPVNTTGEAYHSLLSTAIKIKNWPTLPEFVDWWNLDNLRAQDYKKTEYNGVALMSVAEATYNALCRCLLVCDDEDKILDFTKMLSLVIAAHPEYQYLPYYNAKLLFKIGKIEQAIEALKPFARKKASDFWVWQLLGDEVNDDAEKMKFYCKAALCKGKDEMLVKMREQVGLYLIQHGKREMGKCLIEKVIDTRRMINKAPSYTIQDLIREPWWNATQANWDEAFAQEQATLAEEFLFGKLNTYEVLVTYVNTQKGAISFLTEQRQEGFFMEHSKRIHSIKKNDILRFHAQEISQSGSTKVRRWEVSGEPNEQLCKTVTGILRKCKGGYGFVDKVFVNAALAKAYDDAAIVEVKAVLSYDRKKGTLGWSAIAIK